MSRIDNFFSGYSEHLGGRTPQDVLENGIISIGSRSWSHPEFEEHINRSDSEGKDTSLARKLLEADRSDLTEMRKIPHEELVGEALRNWRHGPRETFVGSQYRAAGLLNAVQREFSENSRPNEVPLYRGAARAPHMDAESLGRPVSFTENRPAAAAFARQRRKETGSGHVYIAEPGEVRGLRMEDYGVTPMNLGKHSEAEWLVHPDSVPIFNDRRKRSR